ncbi:MAG TPA: hypothetical protein VL133_15870, partial [Devosia sp.]|nr:hypothetical protein [Devosia sp.]
MITQFILRALDKKAIWLVAILTIIAIGVPLLNLGLPADHPLHIPNHAVPLFGKYLNYAMLALALDLVWGYCGILSLGHAAFFALGAYAMGMYLMRQIGARGVYANPTLPDFMVFLNYKDLPWFWTGFDLWWFAFAMALIVLQAPSWEIVRCWRGEQEQELLARHAPLAMDAVAMERFLAHFERLSR